MVTIKILPKEIIDIVNISSEIYKLKSIKKVKSKKYFNNRSEVETLIFGFIGELAVAKYIGVEYNPEVLIGNDGGIDLIKNNYKLQIKTSRKKGRDFALNSPTIDGFKCDIGVLTYIEESVIPHKIGGVDVFLGGFTTRKHFENNGYQVDYGYGLRWAIKYDKLISIEQLNQILNIDKT